MGHPCTCIETRKETVVHSADGPPPSAASGDANPGLPQLRSHLSAASIASSTEESSGDSANKAAKAAAASAAAAAVDDSDEIPISRGIVSGPEPTDAIQCCRGIHVKST